MGIRYRVTHKSQYVALHTVGIADTYEAAESVIKVLISMNPEETQVYSIESFDDPEFNPPPEPVYQSNDSTVTQESLDARVKQTSPDDISDALTKEQRIAICTPCEFNVPVMGFGNCNKCRCFTYLKASIKSSTCPEGKW